MSKLSKKMFSVAKSQVGDLIVGIVFGKFSKALPVKRIIENEKVISFWHPKPFYENHILIVPKKAIKNIMSLSDVDDEYILEVYRVVKILVKRMGWKDGGYTMLTNGGTRQEVNQLHFHLFGNKDIQ